jgi:hypothetical protein
MHPHSVLKDCLHGIDKQKEIELYYDLLSSGHSVGEILNSLGHLQSRSEHGDKTIVKHSRSGSDGAMPDMTSEAVFVGAAQTNTRCTLGFSALHEAENYRITKPGATESASSNELGSNDSEQLLGESLPGSEPNFVSLAGAHAPAGPELTVRSGDQESLQPGKFTNVAKWVTFAALSTATVLSVYTAAVVSVSSAGFLIAPGGHDAEPTTTHVQSVISSGTEAVAIRASAAERSETVDEDPKSKKQAVNANSAPVPEPSQSTEPGLVVPGSLQKDAPEVPAIVSASTAHIGQSAEPGRQAQVSAINNRGAGGPQTGRSGDISVRMAKEIRGQQVVRAFYTALERGNGQAASLLVIPEKREAGPFSASELSSFYGRLDPPLRLIGINEAGENLYDVVYSYKVRNGRSCNGRSLVKTINLQNHVLIEKIRSLSRC